MSQDISDYVIVYDEDDPDLVRKVVSYRYLVETRRATLITKSVIRAGIKQSLIFDTGPLPWGQNPLPEPGLPGKSPKPLPGSGFPGKLPNTEQAKSKLIQTFLENGAGAGPQTENLQQPFSFPPVIFARVEVAGKYKLTDELQIQLPDFEKVSSSEISEEFHPHGGTICIDASKGSVEVGGNGTNGNLYIKNKDSHVTIHLDGEKGDIILSNADCAEEFDIAAEEASIDPGTVMILNELGQLIRSVKAYDKKVAGIVSGAGNYQPGIILDRQPSQNKRLPVALMGKVFCKVDASFGAVEVGDMLTTSPTVGYAMKASDPFKAFGAVLGKALRPLSEGQDLIRVLVTLQ